MNTSIVTTRSRKGTGTKQVFDLGHGVAVNWVKAPYTKGKDDIHITINGGSSSKGMNWNQRINKKNKEIVHNVAKELGFNVGVLGVTDPDAVKVTKKHVFIGSQMNSPENALNKWNETVAFASLLTFCFSTPK